MATEYLTVTEAARILGTSSDSVRYYERQRRLKAIRIGTHRIFTRKDVLRFKKLRDMEAEEHAREAAEAVHV